MEYGSLLPLIQKLSRGLKETSEKGISLGSGRREGLFQRSLKALSTPVFSSLRKWPREAHLRRNRSVGWMFIIVNKSEIDNYLLQIILKKDSMTVSTIIDLIYAATAYPLSEGEPKNIVRNILQMESLLKNKEALRGDTPSSARFIDYQTREIPTKEKRNNESIGYSNASSTILSKAL
jgi:hypothetical protein